MLVLPNPRHILNMTLCSLITSVSENVQNKM